MEQALKQRLVGALVITALAAIFVPMFFEDSVDDSRREIKQSDLAIPASPDQSFSEGNPIPQSPRQVLHAPPTETNVTAGTEPQEPSADQNTVENTVQTGQFEAPEPTEEAAPVVEEAPVEPVAKPQAQTEPAPVKPKPQAAKKIIPHSAPEAPAETAKQLATTASPSAKAPELQRWVVQLGSFAKKDNADSLVSKLRGQGFNAYGDTIEVPGKGTMYRVRIGPELDKKRAQATQKKLRQLNAINSMVLAE